MTTEHVTTKSELLKALRDSGQALLERLSAIPPERFEEGRYEGGWNGRQILAHVASIEWTYTRLLEIARRAADTAPDGPAGGGSEGAGLPTRPARGGIGDYNERQVAKRADATVAGLLQEFRTNRDATIAAVEAADEALFVTPIRSAGGVSGPLSNVLNAVAVLHILGHVNDIAGGPA